MIWLVLLNGGCTGEESCSPGTCEIDPCASASADTASRESCCLAEHGRGGLAGEDLSELEASCLGEECDASLYLAEAAAVCLAQAGGLSVGVDRCNARFAAKESAESGFAWLIRNVESQACIDGQLTGRSGQEFEIDAVSGEVVGIAAYNQ
jgi:hypothetical protein